MIGGARSGKSRHAEALVRSAGRERVYLATAQVWDEEMAERVRLHRADRPQGWQTIEEPYAIAPLLARGFDGKPVLLDCLTLWLTNVLLASDDPSLSGMPSPEQACETLLATLASCPGPLVLVSNEVGLGIVPDNALSRRFRDLAGRLHQNVAALADRVDLVTAGIPLSLKPQLALAPVAEYP
ncbi:bifunctional adenosylcobinamide kinase/adenosylcobinamide-phosphate guanylyltransferase [Insolitispirillum peregrinum]|uniref:bifunctional adenosylcobinamide kinase/adenosylcobinamide-phosphate guanylyltransferase n=1 Tax=Insolitispirillum peregrinum TaxID=80876 RepID=UPI003622B8DD